MIPRAGDTVRINSEFVRRWIHCQGCGIPLPAHQDEPPAGRLLTLMASFTLVTLTVRRATANDPDQSKASTLVEFAEIPVAIWLDSAGRYIDCLRCCLEFDADPCPFATTLGAEQFLITMANARPMSADELKTANTLPGAKFCANCGHRLKDPGMGPAYVHCPKCEP